MQLNPGDKVVCNYMGYTTLTYGREYVILEVRKSNGGVIYVRNDYGDKTKFKADKFKQVAQDTSLPR